MPYRRRQTAGNGYEQGSDVNHCDIAQGRVTGERGWRPSNQPLMSRAGSAQQARSIRGVQPASHLRRSRWLHRIGLALLVLALLCGLLIAWKPSRVALQTAILIPSLLGAGPQPLELFSASPRRDTLRYRSDPAAASDLADLWLPATASARQRVGAMVLVLGVNNVGRQYPAVVRFGEALARSGVAVLIPDSADLLAGRLSPAALGGVVDAVETLAARPEVDPARIGLVGLSVGGSLSLLAASDPRIAGRVRWVNAFGAYADAGDYLAEVATHSFSLDGETRAWAPSDLTRELFTRLVVGLVDDAGDRQLLTLAYQQVIVDGSLPAPDPALHRALQTDAGRDVYALLTARSLDRARAAVGALPAPIQNLLDELSPVRHPASLRAQVFVMSDTGDTYIPFVESRRLAAVLQPAGHLARTTELRLFDHVEPEGVDLIGAAPEVWKLLWHVQAVLLQTL